jgi:MFS family permease
LGDRLHGRYANGRIRAALGAYLAAIIVLTTTFLISGLVLTICLATLAAGCLSAVNPPLDAARIDIMPRSLLGRAESVRTLLTSAADVFAPVLFGVLAAHLGLQKTFLVMIGPLIAAGLIGALAVRTYPADAAAAEGHGSRGRQARHPAPS